jgi:hypothetical protein
MIFSPSLLLPSILSWHIFFQPIPHSIIDIVLSVSTSLGITSFPTLSDRVLVSQRASPLRLPRHAGINNNLEIHIPDIMDIRAIVPGTP